MDLADRIISMVAAHAAIRSIALVGSRAEETATAFSDWDFRVEADEFEAASKALPHLLAPLEPLVQQWDRLSPEWCWMLIVRGPAKIDLIFPDEPHTCEPPWVPAPENLDAIEGHFWDWMLWLRGKEERGKAELIVSELEKLSDHLLTPLGVNRAPSSISEAIGMYRHARNRAEKRLGVSVRQDLEEAAAPAFVSSNGT
jgi:hypothetical protein